ncbi:hypothetical protein BG006_008602 [Podila minutissima]|uniref:Galactose oxidase n=1 Tax=Podila minutissima TaxID=64525 RepID=A0A9P5SFI7_9FUNG|nr:hypothetical protein BG006_008602 [Podila minutissima]
MATSTLTHYPRLFDLHDRKCAFVDEPVPDTLEFSLEFGLDKLASLRELRSITVKGNHHMIGNLELDWMAAHWPMLRLINGVDRFLESKCTPDLWRLRLGRPAEWNITDSTWEPVQPKETATLPPVAGFGLKTLLVPGNHTAHITNGTVAHADNTSPFMIEFGRSGCADEESPGGPASTSGLSGIVFNIYNPVMNTWEVTDLANVSEALTPPASGLNANLTGTGNWLSPVTAVDYVNLAWYIILQSTVPLRQLILKKDVSALTSFMSKIDLTESSSTLFPDELLFEGWETISNLNETAPFVGRGVATMMRDSIVIISGTANSFTPGDANIAELRGCDHAYLFSTVDHTWKRQELSVANGVFPETREKAAFIAVGPKIFMHGGIKPYQTVLQDFWILDTDTWTWTRLLDGPGPRADHTLLQYHEYIFAVSGSNVGRNIPIEGVLPIMAYSTNSSTWTNTIRATLDVETTFISNVTRAAIIIGTVVFALVLVVIALSTHLLRKWNQRNYTKVDEAFQLEQQKLRKSGTELPSILKKRYLAEGQDGGRRTRGTRRVRGLKTEVIFESAEYGDEDGDEEDDGFGADDEGDHEVQKVSLLSRAQPAPSSRSLSRQRVEEAYTIDVEEVETEEDEEEDGQAIVRLSREE